MTPLLAAAAPTTRGLPSDRLDGRAHRRLQRIRIIRHEALLGVAGGRIEHPCVVEKPSHVRLYLRKIRVPPLVDPILDRVEVDRRFHQLVVDYPCTEELS